MLGDARAKILQAPFPKITGRAARGMKPVLQDRVQVAQHVFSDDRGGQAGVIFLVGILGENALAMDGRMAPPGF
jgi:hypothetical protein